jgi:hypothetical protein
MGIVETLDGRVADIAAAAAAGAAESERRHPPRRADRRSAGSIGAVRAGGAERAGRRGGASLPPRRGGGGDIACRRLGRLVRRHRDRQQLPGRDPPRANSEGGVSGRDPSWRRAVRTGGRAEVSGDGYLISGRWTYASGCHYAAIAASGVMLFDEGKPAKTRSPERPPGTPRERLTPRAIRSHRGRFLGVALTGNPVRIEQFHCILVNDAVQVIHHWGGVGQHPRLTGAGIPKEDTHHVDDRSEYS